jgi:dihydroorotate dehydrogenase
MKALKTSANTPLQWAYCNGQVADPTTIAGLTFPNKVGMAAGLDKNAECIDGLAAMGFGFVEVGTVTPKAQDGNPKPRMFRLPQAQALINRMGFNNHGLEAFLRNVQKSQIMRLPLGERPLLGLNIGKNASTAIENAVQDYLICLEAVYPYADYVTVNISSPNTKNLRSLQSDEALEDLLSQLSKARAQLAISHQKQSPIFLKIAPDLDDAQIEVIANTLRRHGIDANGKANNAWGVIASNTTISREAVKGLPHCDEAGGLSGAPVLEASNRVIQALRQQLGADFPIIGVGGVMSAANAQSKIDAGANLVQIYTGLIYQGPELVKQCAVALKAKV